MLNYIKITGYSGISDNNDGSYTVHFEGLPSRLITDAELLIASKLYKIDQLKLAAQTSIVSGFVSNALGAPHTYDSDLQKDQLNILGAKVKAVDLEFTCTDVNGVKIPRMHTAAQLNQLFIDGSDWIYSNKLKLRDKAAIVNAAATIAEVDAVIF